MLHSTRPSARTLSLSLSLALVACNPGSGSETGADTGTMSPTTVTPGATEPGTSEPTTTGASASDETSEPNTSAPTTSGASAEATSSSDTSTGSTSEPGTTTDSDTTTTGETTTGDTTTGENGLWHSPNLWYAVDKALIYVEIDPADGSVVQLVHNELVADVPLWHGQNGLTMLEDGTLLGSRESAEGTQIYYIAEPPTTANTPAAAVLLGTVPGEKPGDDPPRIEALYTDCDGRIYLMDTGVDVGSVAGNRLLRFNGKYLKGDLKFDVITDLGNASVADIDDMSPGIVDGEITDGIGFAMDSADLWQIDYTTGTGMKLAGTKGTWGIHALGGPLFDDMTPRLYILSSNAELLRVDLGDYAKATSLLTGPDLMLDSGYNGWSGLAGPLTECMTTIPG